MRELFTEIEIDAPTDRVWTVLTDVEKWAEWNAFIPEVKGEISVGGRIFVRVAPPNGRAMSFKATVTCFHENRDFIWVGSAPIPGAFRGEHIFELRPIDDGRTRLVHREEFSGWMLPLLWGGMEKGTHEGFEQMNRDLKTRVEGNL